MLAKKNYIDIYLCKFKNIVFYKVRLGCRDKELVLARKHIPGGRCLSHKEIQDEIDNFLASGGKIKYLNNDDGKYDLNQKRIEKNLGGGFNPFSKVDALTKR